MAEAFNKDQKKQPCGDGAGKPSGELDTLRQIIIGPEKGRIFQIEQRLDDAGIRANELSRVLPDALVMSTARDQKTARSLQPTIEAAIRSSVQKNPKVLADAIFPLMGPGIRKAISATIMGMIQSFNQLLNHSFSIQGLRWRVEAMRTRKPYAEIVLLHTLLYQVEQVFLIHRQTGLVLQHVVGHAVKFQDPDLVSGMLTAIEDFVHDSFDLKSDQSLDTLRIGSDRSVWIEQGAKAMIAGVIRGTPPLELRHRMAEILNDIHLKLNGALDDYEGDATAFENTRDDLQYCLDSEFKASKKKTSPLLWITSVVLIAAVALWAFVLFRQHRRIDSFLEGLRAQPGIVVTATEKRGNRLVVFGLKDPLVDETATSSPSNDLATDRIDYRWQPYVSLEPKFIMLRVRRLLEPTPAVVLILEGDTLVANGNAGHRWIQRFHELGPTVAGINQTRADHLVDNDLQALHGVRLRIENSRILFSLRSSAIPADQVATMTDIARELHRLERLSKLLDRTIGLRIIGYTDESGSEKANLELSRGRAEAVRRFLIDNGKVNVAMMAIGMGAQQPVGDMPDKNLRAKSRFAGFELVNDAGLRQGND